MQSSNKLKLSKNNTLESENLEHSLSFSKELNERDLWKKFIKGDDGALINIYKLYHNHLYNYGYQFCRESDTLKDTIQEIFMYLLKSRENLSCVQSLKGYLFSAMRRRLLRENAKKSKLTIESNPENNSGFDICLSAETIFIDLEISKDRKTRLEQAINQLTSRQKEAILLFYYEGLSYEEVAKTLELNSVKSARKLIYRALYSLKSDFTNAIISLFLIIPTFF